MYQPNISLQRAKTRTYSHKPRLYENTSSSFCFQIIIQYLRTVSHHILSVLLGENAINKECTTTVHVYVLKTTTL